MSLENRLTLTISLEEIEKRKDLFESQLKAIKSEYLEKVEMLFHDTNKSSDDDYDDKEYVLCDINLLKTYLEKEINTLKELSDQIIKLIIKE